MYEHVAHRVSFEQRPNRLPERMIKPSTRQYTARL